MFEAVRGRLNRTPFQVVRFSDAFELPVHGASILARVADNGILAAGQLSAARLLRERAAVVFGFRPAKHDRYAALATAARATAFSARTQFAEPSANRAHELLTTAALAGFASHALEQLTTALQATFASHAPRLSTTAALAGFANHAAKLSTTALPAGFVSRSASRFLSAQLAGSAKLALDRFLTQPAVAFAKCEMFRSADESATEYLTLATSAFHALFASRYR